MMNSFAVTDPEACWIKTYTGRKFYPLAPRCEDVCLEDVAHALAQLCRFGGHAARFYSVAQHSVLVARLWMLRYGEGVGGYERLWSIRAALLHDAAEAYIADVTRPVKAVLADYGPIERRLAECIRCALRVPDYPKVDEQVADCDDTLLATEARDLMGAGPGEFGRLPRPLEERIEPVGPDGARLMWRFAWERGAECLEKML